MQPEHQHPSDEQLFDYQGGLLPGDAAAAVAGHLASCARCTESVRAAQASMPMARDAGEQLPPDAAARMHEVLAAEFELRSPHAAARARAGAGAVDRGWRRWLVPVVAFGLLAALAGISVTSLGGNDVADGGSVPTTKQAATEVAEQEGGEAADEASTSGGAVAETAATSGGVDMSAGAQGTGVTAKPTPPAAGAEASTATTNGRAVQSSPIQPDQKRDAGGGAAPGSPEVAPVTGGTPTDADGAVATQLDDALHVTLCATAFDGSVPGLPGGRIPTSVTAGPFGLVVACG